MINEVRLDDATFSRGYSLQVAVHTHDRDIKRPYSAFKPR